MLNNVSFIVREFNFNHHCGKAVVGRGYLHAETHVAIKCHDKKTKRDYWIAVPVGYEIGSITGWEKITKKRLQALKDALPDAWHVTGEERRNGKMFYRIDRKDLFDWIYRALALADSKAASY